MRAKPTELGRFAAALSVLASVAAWQTPAAAAPASYEVPTFSDQFGARVAVNDASDELGEGNVTVFERQSSKVLLTVPGSRLPDRASQEPGSPEAPVIIYEDFDFDGRRDLAVLDGFNGCYGAASYQVFLRAAAGFAKSPGFTSLAQEWCGMFEVDAKRKRLHTFGKSGCCTHSFQEYDVVAHAPRLLYEELEDAWQPPYRVTTRHVLGQAPTVERTLMLEEEAGAEPVLAFDLPGPKKQHVEVFISEGELDYAFVSGDDRNVELSYSQNIARPVEERGKTAAPFVWNAQAGELAFRNGGYRYVVVDKGLKVGVRVEHRGKSVFLGGILKSHDGSLEQLRGKKLANLRADAQ